jgi:hypothetical protein
VPLKRRAKRSAGIEDHNSAAAYMRVQYSYATIYKYMHVNCVYTAITQCHCSMRCIQALLLCYCSIVSKCCLNIVHSFFTIVLSIITCVCTLLRLCMLVISLRAVTEIGVSVT